MKKLCVVILLELLAITGFSQNWAQVGQGFGNQTRYFWQDTVTNLLYCTGGFQQVENIPVNACAQWDGNTWDSIPYINSCGAMTIARFNGDLYIAGYSHYVLRWDGIQIDTIANAHYGLVIKLYVFNNELYALGGFDSLNNIVASDIAKFDGSNWSAIDTSNWLGGGMYAATFYLGKLYVAGNMVSSDGTIGNLACWDGTQWSSVGNNLLNNGLGGVNCFAIYNNDLWIGGFFYQSMGNTYNGIARWNGTQWLDPGGGTNYPGQVESMKVFNNQLWIVGNFSTVAGMPAQYVSRWNGTDWCTVGDTFSPGGISDITVYNNELYICGGFKTINSDTFNYVAKWIGGNFSTACGNTTGLTEEPAPQTLTVYPNPATENITFDFADNAYGELHITDQLGREVKRLMLSGETQIEISITDLAAGIYYYHYFDKEENKANGKFIVQ